MSSLPIVENLLLKAMESLANQLTPKATAYCPPQYWQSMMWFLRLRHTMPPIPARGR